MGVTYSVYDFVTGDPLGILPIKAGADWSTALNRSDSLSCAVDLRDPENRKLGLKPLTEPGRTILAATIEGPSGSVERVLAAGLIDGRGWDEDEMTMPLEATGIWDGYFGKTNIMPKSGVTGTLVLDVPKKEGSKKINPAFDTSYDDDDLDLGSIGRQLIAMRLAYTGAPQTIDLPPLVAGTATRSYEWADFKTVAEALDELVDVLDGPDFYFEPVIENDKLRFKLRHGTKAAPRLGSSVGSWPLGEESPISGFTLDDDGTGIASDAWLSADRAEGFTLYARSRNDTIALGYPPADAVDTSRSTVRRQSTLDNYAEELAEESSRPHREVGFSVRGDYPDLPLGDYRAGDVVTIDPWEGHPYLDEPLTVRITSIKGDETADEGTVAIGCVVL